MNIKLKNTGGFSHFEIILTIVVIGVISGAGLFVYNMNHNKSKADSLSTDSDVTPSITTDGSTVDNSEPVPMPESSKNTFRKAPKPNGPPPEESQSLPSSARMARKSSTIRPTIETLYSPNWAGYVVDATNSNDRFTFVSGNVVVPRIICDGTVKNLYIWVGLDGYTNNSVEQVGMWAYCPKGSKTPQYGTWWEMWPYNLSQNLSLKIKPGDNLYMEVKVVPGKYIFTLKNQSTRKYVSYSTRCLNNKCERVNAEWIIERPGYARTDAYFVIPPYTKTMFTNMKLNIAGREPAALKDFESQYNVNPVLMTDGGSKYLTTVSNPYDDQSSSFASRFLYGK
jgi:hypothetical protein